MVLWLFPSTDADVLRTKGVRAGVHSRGNANTKRYSSDSQGTGDKFLFGVGYVR